MIHGWQLPATHSSGPAVSKWPAAADFSLAASQPSPALILRSSRYGADMLHHFPYFGFVSGVVVNYSIKPVGPSHFHVSPTTVLNIDLPLPSG